MSQQLIKGAEYAGENDSVHKPMIHDKEYEKDMSHEMRVGKDGQQSKKGFVEKVKEAIVGQPKSEHLMADKGHSNEAYKQEIDKPHDGHVWKESEKDGMKKNIAMQPSGYGFGENKKRHFGEHVVGPDPLSKELKDKTKDRYDVGALAPEKDRHSISTMKTDPLCKEIRAHANKIPKAPTLHDEDIQGKADNALHKDSALSKDGGLHKDKALSKDEGLHKDAHIPKPPLHDENIRGKVDSALHKDGALSKDGGLHKDAHIPDKDIEKKGLHKDKGLYKDDALRQDLSHKEKEVQDALHKHKGCHKDDPLSNALGVKDHTGEDAPVVRDAPFAQDKGAAYGAEMRQESALKKEGLKDDDDLPHAPGFGKEMKQDNLGAVSGQGKQHEHGLKDEGLVRDKPYDTTHDEQPKGILEGAKEMVAHGFERVKSMFTSQEPAESRGGAAHS